MSRSRRKTPVMGLCDIESAKPYKKQRAGEERTRERALIQDAKKGDEEAASTLEVEQARWDEWSTPRDGKQWIDPKSKWMRK